MIRVLGSYGKSSSPGRLLSAVDRPTSPSRGPLIRALQSEEASAFLSTGSRPLLTKEAWSFCPVRELVARSSSSP